MDQGQQSGVDALPICGSTRCVQLGTALPKEASSRGVGVGPDVNKGESTFQSQGCAGEGKQDLEQGRVDSNLTHERRVKQKVKHDPITLAENIRLVAASQKMHVGQAGTKRSKRKNVQCKDTHHVVQTRNVLDIQSSRVVKELVAKGVLDPSVLGKKGEHRGNEASSSREVDDHQPSHVSLETRSKKQKTVQVGRCLEGHNTPNSICPQKREIEERQLVGGGKRPCR